ncbi:42786_t:CDS:2 [Gigaspora margarita]|uniref:42786_t:CDS:1 n=1 Tax=Gigaspora margarita TaxID=4874 RepID=A0ABN7VXK3_GIGMA|nr:42786_t:CDS:2 [Gigaspora margarita]
MSIGTYIYPDINASKDIFRLHIFLFNNLLESKLTLDLKKLEEHLREVVHLIKLNLETPLIPNDGIEERNGLLTLSKESTVQGVKYFIKTIMKRISKELHRTKIIKKLIT